NRLHERFIKGNERIAIAGDSSLVTQGLTNRLAEDDSDIFDRVVDIDVNVAGGANGEVNQGVLGERGEHVVEERHRGGDLGRAGAVEVQGELDARFARFTRELCGSRWLSARCLIHPDSLPSEVPCYFADAAPSRAA